MAGVGGRSVLVAAWEGPSEAPAAPQLVAILSTWRRSSCAEWVAAGVRHLAALNIVRRSIAAQMGKGVLAMGAIDTCMSVVTAQAWH